MDRTARADAVRRRRTRWLVYGTEVASVAGQCAARQCGTRGRAARGGDVGDGGGRSVDGDDAVFAGGKSRGDGGGAEAAESHAAGGDVSDDVSGVAQTSRPLGRRMQA